MPNVATIEAVVAAAVVDCSSKTNFLNGKTMERQWKDNGKDNGKTMEKQWKNNTKSINYCFRPKKKEAEAEKQTKHHHLPGCCIKWNITNIQQLQLVQLLFRTSCRHRNTFVRVSTGHVLSFSYINNVDILRSL